MTNTSQTEKKNKKERKNAMRKTQKKQRYYKEKSSGHDVIEFLLFCLFSSSSFNKTFGLSSMFFFFSRFFPFPFSFLLFTSEPDATLR